MSVNHPLLRELKGHVLFLRTKNSIESVDDSHPRLLSLCVNLESIFRLGLRCTPSLVGTLKQDYWSWIEFLGKCRTNRLSPETIRLIESVRKDRKVNTVQSKGRLFLRAALVHGNLAHIIGTFVKDYNQLSKVYYCETPTCIGHEILSEIFLSLLLELQEVKFNLNLRNCGFLNESWLLPLYNTYEFVPCMKLGVHIGYAHGRVVTLSVEDGSVAGEDEKIEVGDVLDEIDGECISQYSRRKQASLFARCKTQPLKVSVVKCRAPNGSIYLPLMAILCHLGIQNRVLPTKTTPPSVSGVKDPPISSLFFTQPVLGPNDCLKRRVKFHGRSFVGLVGTMSVIDTGIQVVIDRKSTPLDVWFEVVETSVIVSCCKTAKMIYHHNYTQIGSCGRRTDMPLTFCYVAGETICNMANEFYCYVFESDVEEEVKMLLQNIALGFQRTHFAV